MSLTSYMIPRGKILKIGTKLPVESESRRKTGLNICLFIGLNIGETTPFMVFGITYNICKGSTLDA